MGNNDQEAAASNALDTMTNPLDGAVMVYVPAGEFTMGSEEPDSMATPVHTVSTDAYWVYQYEVTNEMYAAFLREVGNVDQAFYAPDDDALTPPIRMIGGDYQADERYANAAAAFLPWTAAREYCELAGARLLTEAEWEKAARGGLEGMRYPWGNEVPVSTLGAFNGVYLGGRIYGLNVHWYTQPVGNYAPNGFGLYDMFGNIAEWVSSCEAPYPYSPSDGREDLNSYCFRIYRGGNIGDIELWEIATRKSNDPGYAGFIGFRCGMDADP